MGFLSQEIVDRLEANLGEKKPKQAEILRGEAMFTGEAADYPRSLSQFVGQEAVKEQLEVKIASAKARGARLDHTGFFAGEHGIGKTTLAYLTAYLMDVGLVATTGKNLSAEEFRNQVMAMSEGDIIFIDEVHMVVDGGRNKADWLLPWMLGHTIKTNRGVEQTPDVTLIMATTDVGKLPATMTSRLVNTPEFHAYTNAEGALLTGTNAERLEVDLEPDYWPDVARAAANNPRMIRKILAQIRDLDAKWPETHPNLAKAFDWAGVTEDGLTATALRMLAVLGAERAHTLAIDTIRDKLGEPGSIRQHERVLLDRGLVEITGQGRRLTPAGVRRALEVLHG